MASTDQYGQPIKKPGVTPVTAGMVNIASGAPAGMGGPTVLPPPPQVAVAGGATPSLPSVPGASVNPITPGAGLRGTTIAPTTQPGADPLTQRAIGLTEGAESAVRGLQPNAYASVPAGGDYYTNASRDLLAGAAGGLPSISAPNRSELARQAFELLREQGQPGFEADLRRVGQLAGSLGRVGAGMTTSNLGDVLSNREQYLGQEARRLALEAAGDTVQDQLAAAELGLRRGDLSRVLAGDIFGQGSSLRGEARAEREFGVGLDRDRASGLSDLARQVYGLGESVRREEGGLRDELRGERGYEDTLAGEASDAEIRRLMLEESLLSGEAGRYMDYLRTLEGVGGRPPTDALLKGSEAYGTEAADAFGGVGDLLAEYFAGRRTDNPRTPYASGVVAGGGLDITPRVKRTVTGGV